MCGPGRCSVVSRDGYRAVHGADRREYLCWAKFQYRGVDAVVNASRTQPALAVQRFCNSVAAVPMRIVMSQNVADCSGFRGPRHGVLDWFSHPANADYFPLRLPVRGSTPPDPGDRCDLSNTCRQLSSSNPTPIRRRLYLPGLGNGTVTGTTGP